MKERGPEGVKNNNQFEGLKPEEIEAKIRGEMVKYLENNLTKSNQTTSQLTEKQLKNVRKRVLQSKKQDLANISSLGAEDPQL